MTIEKIKKHPLLLGTVLLSGSGIISRILGFFYRIFLSRTIGASGLGLYQLIFPIFTLCLAISASGIQTAISRFVAIETAKGNTGRTYLAGGLFLSGSIAIIFSFLVHGFSPLLAENILKEPRCEDLLKVMSFSLVPSAVHSCFNGYYYGKKQSSVPSVCQIIEQLARVGGTFLIYQILKEQGLPLEPLHAVWGLVISELAGLLVNTTAFTWRIAGAQTFSSLYQAKQNAVTSDCHKSFDVTHPYALSNLPLTALLAMALPLTANHVLMTLSHSLENLLLPQKLMEFGYTSDEALTHFGILTGMAMSVIFFPGVITNSLSVLLLPRISEAKAACNHQLVSDTIKGAAACGVCLGSVCTFFFLFSADWFGTVLFEDNMAGFYIRILSILCPFMYTNSLLNSIVNGLGYANLTLICNLSGCAVRIAAIWFLIPTYGMYAYIIAMIVSQVLTMGELIWIMRKRVGNKCCIVK